MTEEGLTEWITDGVHPADYQKIATEYLPNFGKLLYQPIGYPRANSVLQPALDAIWIGDMTAEEALTTRSEEHTSELQSLMRNSSAVFCLKKNKTTDDHH